MIDVKSSVAVQLLKRVFAVYLIIAISVTIVHMYQEYRHMKDLVTEELQDLEQTFSPGLAASIWYLDYSIVNSISGGIIKVPAVVGVKIIDQEGKEVSAVGSIIDKNGNLIDVSKSGARTHTTNQPTLTKVFWHKFKLTHNNIYLGEVYFYSSYSTVFKRVKVSFFFLILNSIIKTVALWVIFLWFGKKYLSTPLAVFTDNLKSLNLDDLKNRVIDIKLKGQNELKLLEDAFNFMLGKLGVAKDRLLSFQNLYQQALIQGQHTRPDIGIVFKHIYSNISVSEATLYSKKGQHDSFVETDYFSPSGTSVKKYFSAWIFKTILEKTENPLIINHYSKHHPLYPEISKTEIPPNGCHLAFIQLDADTYCVLYKEAHQPAFDSSDTAYLRSFLNELRLIENSYKIAQEKKKIEEEKKNLQQQLYHSQKMEAIGTLAGGIAHDFNNILMPIIGYTEISLEELTPEDSIHHNLNTILRSGLRAKELVQQILAFSRQEKQELKPLRIQPIINETLRLLRSSIPAQVSLQKEIDTECGPIMANPVQVHQILMNLLNNAFHAMKNSPGDLYIRLKEKTLTTPVPAKYSGLKPGKHVVINVQDSGIGIKEDVIDKIFDPYFTTKKLGEGTGLGLSVIHGIVKDYQGIITVDSVVGEGTSFSIYIPGLEEQVEQKKLTPAHNIPTGNENILIIDDEEYVALTLSYIMESLGYQVTVINDSRDAVCYLEDKSNLVDLIISDLVMPDFSGLELAHKIKDVRPELPVIICSGYGNQVSQEEYQKAGVEAYVMKPVLKQDLATKVRLLLDQSENRLS